ncbi:MAG: 4Fe-4S dicluster domain-containing protein, partial [Polyangiaceae bacterium]|nr:4Fe-4S dicluster domain-containing protein [Polyangiaceae bacterium]
MGEPAWRGPNERRNLLHGEQSPEFPAGADAPPPTWTRREWLALMGASAALAGAEGCSRGPAERIVPYVDQPPELTPSVAARYATTMAIDGYGVGMIVTCHEGRPTKAEGNPHHPASRGALGTFQQASILSLYDPGRARELTHLGTPSTWRAFVEAIRAPPPPGKRTHLLLEPTSAPHVTALVARARRHGEVVVHFDSPVDRSNVWSGSRLAFGRVLEPRWDVARAEVVVALDADFLAATTPSIDTPRGWAERRRLRGPRDSMSRLYVAEPRLTVTGMSADERLALRAADVRSVAAALVAVLFEAKAESGSADARQAAMQARSGPFARWAEAAARDLLAHPGTGLVVAGDGQPAEVHALVHAANELLGNAGTTVTYAPSPIFEAGGESHGLHALLRALDSGDVATLVMVGGNPVYSSAADLRFGERLREAATVAYVGPHANETARACGWFVPEAHFFEAWGDARAFDGTPSIQQPLVRPLGEGWTAAQLLAAFAGEPEATTRDLVRAYWRTQTTSDFTAFWEQSLVRGVVAGAPSVPADRTARVDWSAVARALAPRPADANALEITYYTDARVHDGRFADNAWLQELPDPVTKLTWDNAAVLSPETAAKVGVDTSDVVEIEVRGKTVRAPALVMPGTADGVVALALGYGLASHGRTSDGAGANAFAIRDSSAPWFDQVRLRKTGHTRRLALTQEHWSMEGRPIVLRATLDAYRKKPAVTDGRNDAPRSLYHLAPNAPVQWGMTIDLNACTGCSACVVACVAENNVPVVGRSGVALSREMHWLRIDRYFVGSAASPAVVVQPMLCQHCEQAPCEYVCPVNATVHSPDGLNEMVYNRCVGTRFCNNNCPYKVRRFNFFNYTARTPPTVRLAMNPDVTVR